MELVVAQTERDNLFSLQRSDMFIDPTERNVFFAPEEQDVYNYEHIPNGLAPLGAKQLTAEQCQ